jgi:hypothetical protein
MVDVILKFLKILLIKILNNKVYIKSKSDFYKSNSSKIIRFYSKTNLTFKIKSEMFKMHD